MIKETTYFSCRIFNMEKKSNKFNPKRLFMSNTTYVEAETLKSIAKSTQDAKRKGGVVYYEVIKPKTF
jgi:hypothetical protein